jgi:hypothetical protein
LESTEPENYDDTFDTIQDLEDNGFFKNGKVDTKKFTKKLKKAGLTIKDVIDGLDYDSAISYSLTYNAKDKAFYYDS